MYIVYILQSEKDKHFYIGQTNNLEARLQRHNSGQVLSTKHRRPFQLIHSETFETRKESVQRELYLKSLKGGHEFQQLLIQWGLAKW